MEDPNNTTGGFISLFIFLFFFIVPLVITAIKKKKQLGKLWLANTEINAELKIAGKKLQCSHCGNVKFQKREGILVTSWVAFFRLSYWNLSSSCYTCVNCGHVEWFVRPKEEEIEFEQPKQ